MSAEIKLRRDTAAAWTAANPTLSAGEPGWETDTSRLKIGDGATAWTALDYYETAPAGGGGGPIMLASGRATSTNYVDRDTTSTTFVDVDPALAVTFTAPANGQVEVSVSAFSRMNSSNALAAYWCLREGTTPVPGTERTATTAVTGDVRHMLWLVTGLTPGNTYTYKFAHRAHQSSGSVRVSYGNLTGDALMVARATAL